MCVPGHFRDAPCDARGRRVLSADDAKDDIAQLHIEYDVVTHQLLAEQVRHRSNSQWRWKDPYVATASHSH